MFSHDELDFQILLLLGFSSICRATYPRIVLLLEEPYLGMVSNLNMLLTLIIQIQNK
jgi:hypothetical protein